MRHPEAFLDDTVLATLAIYAEMRRGSAEEHEAAEQELRRYVQQLIAVGEHNRESLMVKGLVHLRQREDRPHALPAWMRRRVVVDPPRDEDRRGRG